MQVGARQVECCVNGIGERAGNASLEELAMVLRTRPDAAGGLWSGIDTTEITRASRLVSRLSGYPVQPNKAVVGRNAFAHEAGIHQHGVLNNPLTYEIMDAKSVGLAQSSIVLGKHSGRHALGAALLELGYELDRAELSAVFDRFKEVADRKGRISAADLEALMSDEMRAEAGGGLRLEDMRVTAETGERPVAKVTVTDADGGVRDAEAEGDGPVDALMKAIDAALGTTGTLLEYTVSSVTSGKDALGEARVVCDIGGRAYAGQSVSTDVLEASAVAYLRAVDASRHANQDEEQVVAGGV
jgi:2-isopropylmalate synthase